MKRLALTALLLAAGCSKKAAMNYRHCLKLRIGMTREEVFTAMGQPEETFPYIEGKSLPHHKGRTAYEWSTPTTMSAPNRVSIDDASGTATSIRCGDSSVTTAVFVEPPAPAVPTTTVLYGEQPSTAPAAAPAPARGPSERAPASAAASGKPLTQ